MEPETVVIKVKHEDTLRRFISPVINQELDLNMDRLRDKIRYFFKFSPETDFTLTYIDEDDDVVGLVDDEDLRDVVRQALNPVRITVKVNAEKSSKPRAQSSKSYPSWIVNCNPSEGLKSVRVPKVPGAAEVVDALTKTGLPYIGMPYTSPLSDTAKTKEASEDPSLKGKEELPKLQKRQLDALKEAYKRNLHQLGQKPIKVGSSTNHPDSTSDGMKNVDLDPGFIVECPFSGAPVRNDFNTPPQFSNSAIFHRGIRCDGCGVHPITGVRYKSKVKDDYDLCGICFAKMGNDTDYISIDHPVTYRHGFSFKGPHRPNELPLMQPASKNYKAGPPLKLDSRFIRDVNILDGTIIAPLTPFTKIWRMRNSGTLPWPQNTKLVWIGGDILTCASSVEIQIPASGLAASGLAINQELDVSVDFVSPQLPGRYISYWRMASPSGQKFGQRVWVLIQVNASPIEPFHEVDPGFNLNLPPVDDDQNDPEIIQKDPQPVMDNNHDESQEVKFPIDNSLLVGGGDSSPTISVAPPSSLYPNVEPALSNPAPVVASTSSTSAVNDNASAEVNVEEEDVQGKIFREVEEKLLRELEDMGFKQVDLNKEVLRTNEYDLQQSVDDLCGVSEWDPILVELQEMGFEDKEMNKKLLKKNNGSIKRVVMDLITDEGR